MWDQAITDSYGYLFTAECGTCQGIECSSEGEDAQNQSVPKVVLKKALSSVPLVLGNRVWFKLLHCSHCSQAQTQLIWFCTKCTLSCWVPKLWIWTQSNSEYSKHKNKPLHSQLIYGPLPVAAAELPEINFLPEAPPFSSKNHPAWFCKPVAIRWKGQSDSTTLTKHQMEGEFCAYKQSSCN